MLANQDVEAIAHEIDRLSVDTGRALAESYAANVTNELDELSFRVVAYIFMHAAADLVDRSSILTDADKLTLRNGAIPTIRIAFERRLAELRHGVH